MICSNCRHAARSAFEAGKLRGQTSTSRSLTSSSQHLTTGISSSIRMRSPTVKNLQAARAFSSHVAPKRPSIAPSTITLSAIQFPSSTTLPSAQLSPISLQTSSFSSSAQLGAPRDTFNPSRLVQKRRHGFLSRVRTRNGRKILKRRRAKGRRNLSW